VDIATGLVATANVIATLVVIAVTGFGANQHHRLCRCPAAGDRAGFATWSGGDAGTKEKGKCQRKGNPGDSRIREFHDPIIKPHASFSPWGLPPIPELHLC
jgi:hypothetical protein